MHRLAAPLLALTLAAQKSDQPLVRVTTRLVEINVIVRDKGGPVRDLSQDDFVLTEKGKPRKIAFFQKYDSTAPAPPMSSATPAAPGIVTNRPTGSTPRLNVTIVLLDGLNTAVKDQDYAKQQFLAYLKQVRPEDRIAVYTLGSQLRVLNDFTNDASRLAAAVAKFTGANTGVTDTEIHGATAASTEGNDEIVAEAIENAMNDLISDRSVRIRAETTAAAMEAIANHISGIPGRKNLIWISSSFPFVIGHIGDGQANSEDTAFDNDINGVTAAKRGGGAAQNTALYQVNDRDGNPARTQMNFTREIERATMALNNAGIAVYPIDARGLTVLPKSMTVEQNYGRSKVDAIMPSAASSSTITTGSTAMHALADNTGGIIFQNGNDLRKAIQTAVEDGEVTYTLGFYPDPSTLDSKFHDLKVQVKRKDVEVRYRKGYLAMPESAAAKNRVDTVRAALDSPLPATGITLTAGAEKGDKPAAMRLMVAIEPREITLEQKDGKWTGALDLVFAQRSADGTHLNVSTTPLGLSLDASQHDKIFQYGFSFTKNIDLAAGAVEVRVLVADRASGRMGTLTVPVPR
ncbi:MAG TPA: VWA domain-containing protein [Verrucomicrobiae bacterium]|nr:VWA domain-containing protein [Verrucomicrobiae bacterium]